MTLRDDTNYLKHPGWGITVAPDGCNTGYDMFFSDKTYQYIKSNLDSLLCDITERPILVTEKVIRNTMETIFQNNRPAAIGDIYSKYHMTGLDCQHMHDINKMVQEVIEVIYNYVKNEYQMATINRSMSAYNALYGTCNELGLLAHPPIKLLEKRPQPMMFNMRY